MDFVTNPQREAYISAKGKIVLNACPGSGKTTCMAKKMMELQKEYETTIGRFVGVVCLSFTNAAKDEINEKYTQLSGTYLGFPHKVATIDSFINQYITLPFYYLLDGNFKRPKILDDNSFIDDLWMQKFRFKGLDNKPICFAYPPRSIRFESDGSFSSNGYRPAADKVNQNVFNDYCRQLKSWQIRNGLITTGDSAYIALKLLTEHPKIGIWLATRFPHIIVDEAQDNSAVQHALFDKLIEHGLNNIEFIGDPYQSLYEWRDANPKLFLVKYEDVENWQGLNLTDDRRSPQKIINCFSRIRKEGDSIITSACDIDKGLPIMIYKYCETTSELIIQHFDRQCQINKLTNNHIVVRGNTLKNQMLGKEADKEPWKSWIPYDLIEAKYQYAGNEVKAAVQTFRSIVSKLLKPQADYHEMKELERDLKEDILFNAKLMEALHDLPMFNLSISNWTIQTQRFLTEKFDLAEHVNFDLKNRNSPHFDKNILADSIEVHFKRSYSETKIPITTVHQVKGKSLDAILVFFNETKHKDNITFDDISTSGVEFPSEKKRIIYVALSRPKHLLAMAFPANISDEDLENKFGKDIHIVNQQELIHD